MDDNWTIGEVLETVKASVDSDVYNALMNLIDMYEHKLEIYESFAESKGVHSYKDVEVKARQWLE